MKLKNIFSIIFHSLSAITIVLFLFFITPKGFYGFIEMEHKNLYIDTEIAIGAFLIVFFIFFLTALLLGIGSQINKWSLTIYTFISICFFTYYTLNSDINTVTKTLTTGITIALVVLFILLLLSKKNQKWINIFGISTSSLSLMFFLVLFGIMMKEITYKNPFINDHIILQYKNNKNEYLLQQRHKISSEIRYIYVYDKFLGIHIYQKSYSDDIFEIQGSVNFLSHGLWIKKDKKGNLVDELQIPQEIIEHEEEEKEDYAYELDEEKWIYGPSDITDQARNNFYDNYFYHFDSDPFNIDFSSSNLKSIQLHNDAYIKKSYTYIHGLSGLIYYSSLHEALFRFNEQQLNQEYTDYEQPDNFFDLSLIESFIGLPLFDSELREKNGFRFVCYNTKVVDWVFNNLIPQPEDQYSLDSYHNYQDVYNVLASRYFRLTFEAYLTIHKNIINKEISVFHDQVIEKGMDVRSYLDNNYPDTLQEYIVEPITDNEGYTYYDNEWQYYGPKVAIGWWFRRMEDQSASNLLQGVIKVLQLYDQEWYEDQYDKYDISPEEIEKN